MQNGWFSCIYLALIQGGRVSGRDQPGKWEGQPDSSQGPEEDGDPNCVQLCACGRTYAKHPVRYPSLRGVQLMFTFFFNALGGFNKF